MSSLFTKIIRGDIPSYKVFEDKYTFAFLDIFPVQKGHTLIVPKLEVDYFLDAPEEHYLAVMKSARIVSRAVEKATGCKRVGLWVEGLEVPHFHVHLCPMWGPGDIKQKSKKLNPEEMKFIQERILASF